MAEMKNRQVSMGEEQEFNDKDMLQDALISSKRKRLRFLIVLYASVTISTVIPGLILIIDSIKQSSNITS